MRLPTMSISMCVRFLSLLSLSLPSSSSRFSHSSPWSYLLTPQRLPSLFSVRFFAEGKESSSPLKNHFTISPSAPLTDDLTFPGLSFFICQQNTSTVTVLSAVSGKKKKKKVFYERGGFGFKASHLYSFLIWISEGPALHDQGFSLLADQGCIWI